MAVNPKILEVIACPLCKGKLVYNKTAQNLVCRFHKISFPIKKDIPIMLITQAKSIQ
jgi:uncharacterized protein YbaR (Trm112 family)